MTLALHAPAVGYYARRGNPVGAAGDFYTSAELHPGFAALIGRQVQQLWLALDRPAPFMVHEGGPGSGLFARDLLDSLRAAAPDLYTALRYGLEETSPALREIQQRTLAHAGHLGLANWVESPAEHGPVNLVFANELLDALPVHLVETRAGQLVELYVAWSDDRAFLQPGRPSTPLLVAYFERLGLQLVEGCRAEVNLAALDWLRAAARSIGRGLLLVLDYGYPAEILYSPSRRSGTLLCYYRHTLSSDPLRRIGDQDITSHVDFSSARWAGESAGLTTLGLVSQSSLLHNLGWPALRSAVELAAPGQLARTANLRCLDALVDRDGLGRLLALVQQRGIDNFVPLGLVGGSPGRWDEPPLRRPEHLLLPGSADAEGLPDFEAQWAEAFGLSDMQTDSLDNEPI
jgi:SAM-dependent MidA family methyltransferase